MTVNVNLTDFTATAWPTRHEAKNPVLLGNETQARQELVFQESLQDIVGNLNQDMVYVPLAVKGYKHADVS